MSDSKQTFLLIHGSQHGAWCWHKLVPLLEQAGHQVHAIDLPSHGDDKAYVEEVTLDTYVQAVDDYVNAHKLNKLIIVGHSMAGAILMLVVSKLEKRIKRLIFLAAVVPNEGESVLDTLTSDRQKAIKRMVSESNNQSFKSVYAVARESFFSDLTESEARKYYKFLTPQSFKAFSQKASFSSFYKTNIANHYILCKKDRVLSPVLREQFASRINGKCSKIAAGHDVMLSQPKKLAKLLIR